MKALPFALLTLLLAGCGGSKISDAGLYWGNYSTTLYQVNHKPTEKNRQKHLKELRRIVQKSTGRKLRVPPGVYAQLGIYALESGETSTAREYFQLELDLYPESRVLMQKVLEGKAGIQKNP